VRFAFGATSTSSSDDPSRVAWRQGNEEVLMREGRAARLVPVEIPACAHYCPE
jgi:hypothetical protein